MKVLAFLVISSLFTIPAFAESCPDMAGDYTCISTDVDTNQSSTEIITISQSLAANGATIYQILDPDLGAHLKLTSDNITRSEMATEYVAYVDEYITYMMSLTASCNQNSLEVIADTITSYGEDLSAIFLNTNTKLQIQPTADGVMIKEQHTEKEIENGKVVSESKENLVSKCTRK